MQKIRPVSKLPLTFSLRFSTNQIARLEDLADEQGVTRADLVRAAVDRMLQEKANMKKAAS